MSVSVSSPSRLKEAGLADLLKTRIVARPPSSWEGKWTFLDTWWWKEGEEEFELEEVEDGEVEGNRGEQGAELARWCCCCLGCKSGNMMLGTRD